MTLEQAKLRFDTVQDQIFELERRQAEFERSQAEEKLRYLRELKLARDELEAALFGAPE